MMIQVTYGSSTARSAPPPPEANYDSFANNFHKRYGQGGKTMTFLVLSHDPGGGEGEFDRPRGGRV